MAKFTPKKKVTGRERPIGTHVEIQHDNFERGLRLWKRKCSDAGTVQEVRERQAFIKPTEKRKKAKAAAKQRTKREQAKNVLRKKRMY
jgi:small subunit ribosomal protein S21